MAEIPADIIVMWPGANGSIPSGWGRVTALDSRFPYGASNVANGGSNAGSDTHSNHSSGSHTHSTNSHTHSSTVPSYSENARGLQAWPYAGGAQVTTIPGVHSHSATSGSTGSGTSGSGTSSTNSDSSIPSYYSMIFIKSDGTPTGFPDDCVVFWFSTSAPDDWGQHGASVGKFIRGASSGSDGGTTGGGSHSHSTTSHSHGGVSHDHASATSGGSNETVIVSDAGGNAQVDPNHTHPNDLASSSPSLSSAGGGTSGSTSYEPPYRTLWGLENTSGGDSWLEDAIVMWVGNYNAIPDDWAYCNGSDGTPDMRDKFIKTSSSGGSVDGTGGANGHSHSAPGAHGHGWSHTHTFGATPDSGNIKNWANNAGGAQQGYANTSNSGHAHSSGTSGGGGSTGSTGFSFGASSDSRPASHSIIYLMAPEDSSAGGGNVGIFGSNF